jgi:hypothetical protein
LLQVDLARLQKFDDDMCFLEDIIELLNKVPRPSASVAAALAPHVTLLSVDGVRCLDAYVQR